MALAVTSANVRLVAQTRQRIDRNDTALRRNVSVAGKKKGGKKKGKGDDDESEGQQRVMEEPEEQKGPASDPDEALEDAERRMQKAVETTKADLASVRTGRATPNMLDRVQVEYYGEKLPLPQIAGVTAKDPRTLVVKPYDQGAFKAIEKAISTSDIGLGQPNSDGEVLILPIPELTQERRKEMAKIANTTGEEGKVAVRNVRRNCLKELDGFFDSGSLSEDLRERYGQEVQKLTDRHVKEIDSLVQSKQDEIESV